MNVSDKKNPCYVGIIIALVPLLISCFELVRSISRLLSSFRFLSVVFDFVSILEIAAILLIVYYYANPCDKRSKLILARSATLILYGIFECIIFIIRSLGYYISESQNDFSSFDLVLPYYFEQISLWFIIYIIPGLLQFYAFKRKTKKSNVVVIALEFFITLYFVFMLISLIILDRYDTILEFVYDIETVFNRLLLVFTWAYVLSQKKEVQKREKKEKDVEHTVSHNEKLKHLKELYDRKEISEEEFLAQKKQILDTL